MLTLDEAANTILDSVRPSGMETVGLTEIAGRVLAEEIVADSDVPFTDNSAMDGYAVCSASVAGAAEGNPAILDVTEEVPAGKVPLLPVTPGAAARIMTGAPVPSGADAVVMVEYTERRGDKVAVKAPVSAGDNIRRAGEDIRKGALLFSPGRIIGPADAGVIASAGRARIKVARRPAVGIISTGDEIIEPDTPAGAGKVRNSNSYTLYSLCRAAGADPRYLGVIPDRRDAIEAAFLGAAETCDAVITSGGVSAGDFDFVKEVLRSIGEIQFWKVKIKPGKPLAFGKLGDALLFGLPGNPVSVMVSFEMFVRPALLKMMGASDIFRKRTTARMEHDIADKPARAKIFRGIASRTDGGLTVRTTGGQGSGILMSMVLANCFIYIPYGTATVKKDETVEIIPLDGFPV